MGTSESSVTWDCTYRDHAYHGFVKSKFGQIYRFHSETYVKMYCLNRMLLWLPGAMVARLASIALRNPPPKGCRFESCGGQCLEGDVLFAYMKNTYADCRFSYP